MAGTGTQVVVVEMSLRDLPSSVLASSSGVATGFTSYLLNISSRDSATFP